jgi:hypothetical protein
MYVNRDLSQIWGNNIFQIDKSNYDTVLLSETYINADRFFSLVDDRCLVEIGQGSPDSPPKKFRGMSLTNSMRNYVVVNVIFSGQVWQILMGN